VNSPAVNWDSLDWPALDRLRDRFLAARPGGVSYWSSRSDLANYDFTFARRIGWKWDAVLRELKGRGWTPPSEAVLDWGCGSGVAGRRVIECFGKECVKTLRVFDHSALAVDFAMERARSLYPGTEIHPESEPADGGIKEVGTLIISHVLNELDEAGGRELRKVIDQSDAVLWVEPGTYGDSRSLIALRESLRESFHVIAPCTHHAPCGLLVPGNDRHWCHHFAKPPAGIMADSNWVRFAQRAGIDLRSLPYSFLVLERRGLREPVPGLLPEGCSRIIGEPRFYKGFARVFNCRAEGVREAMLQKRDAPDLFKALKNGEAEPVQRWAVEEGRIRPP